jgi:hypothetical protein
LILEGSFQVATAIGLQNVDMFLLGHSQDGKEKEMDDDGGLFVTAEKSGGGGHYMPILLCGAPCFVLPTSQSTELMSYFVSVFVQPFLLL